MTDIMTCQSKDLLVTYLYEEATAEERRVVEAHLATCAGCRAEVDALAGVRTTLSAWEAPAPATHVRVVADTAPPAAASRRWWVALPLAAAAVLVLAAAAAVANLEIRYGPDGFAVRTGWARSGGAASAVPAGGDAARVPVPAAAPDETAWRQELVALEQQLRREFAASRGQAAPAVAEVRPASAAVSSRMSDEELLRRVQQLVDDSEIRQQRNLALRMAEVSREFAMQRQTDLVQIQQGFGRLEGQTKAEAARAQEIMNYIMRVSQQQPPR